MLRYVQRPPLLLSSVLLLRSRKHLDRGKRCQAPTTGAEYIRRGVYRGESSVHCALHDGAERSGQLSAHGGLVLECGDSDLRAASGREGVQRKCWVLMT